MVVLRVNNESKDESQKHKHKYLDEYANNKGNLNVIQGYFWYKGQILSKFV